MKKLFYLTIIIFRFIAFSQSQDYLGKWRNSDTTELVKITSNTILLNTLVKVL
jgi:hypothetical protein